MSRVANKPIKIPSGVDVRIDGHAVTVKGSKGSLDYVLHDHVKVSRDGDELRVSAQDGAKQAIVLAGTSRALLSNMVTGVSDGFERKLQIIGIGYRAQLQGKKLNLSLGYSHPIEFEIPDGVEVETPSQTEILVKGIDKQQVGQVAANIRAFRKPEPYKGKGVRYADEHVRRKEAKKT
jgi:large subunit ribosomal protein L6